MRLTRNVLVVLGLAAVGCTNDYGSLRFVDESELVGGAAGVSGSAGAATQGSGGQPATGSGGSPSGGSAGAAGGG
jgi:hypothetical protein